MSGTGGSKKQQTDNRDATKNKPLPKQQPPKKNRVVLEIDTSDDEMMVDPSLINSISVSDIAMVKVIKDYFAGGFGGASGAIAIYTKRGGITGSLSDATTSTKLRKTVLHGFDKETSFVNPDYNDENFKNISEDLRTTLYWNPYLETSSDESKIKFFNNDDAKNFRLIIMGFDTKDYIPIYYNEIVK